MPLSPHPILLVIDHNADSRLLLARTLQRKFAGAIIEERETAPAAMAAVQASPIDVVICHRVEGYEGPTLVALLRKINASVPIIMVSGINRTVDARNAGANAFVHFDEWLTIGTVVERLLQKKSPGNQDEK